MFTRTNEKSWSPQFLLHFYFHSDFTFKRKYKSKISFSTDFSLYCWCIKTFFHSELCFYLCVKTAENGFPSLGSESAFQENGGKHLDFGKVKTTKTILQTGMIFIFREKMFRTKVTLGFGLVWEEIEKKQREDADDDEGHTWRWQWGKPKWK